MRINEVAAAGELDWIELVNIGDGAQSLDGWTLSDDAADPGKAPFPDGLVLESGAFLIVEVTDESLGFKLGSDEEVHLFDAQQVLVDEADWDEGESPDGGSYARAPDGTGNFSTASAATRGASNG